MDRLLGNASAPVREKLIDSKTGLLSAAWLDYFQRLPPTLGAIPSRLNAVSLSDQSASLSATDFSNGELAAGLYRLTYYTEIDSAGGGSIQVTFGWTRGGVAREHEGITLTLGAAETAGNMGESTIVRLDAGSEVTYETAFTGGRAYNLDVTLEKVYVL